MGSPPSNACQIAQAYVQSKLCFGHYTAFFELYVLPVMTIAYPHKSDQI